MSKIDEIVQCIWDLYSKVDDDDDNTIYRVLAKKLEQLRPYVELGELVVELWKYDKIFFNDRKDLQSTGKLIQQIREQENEQTN